MATTKTTKWTPNEKQKRFLEILGQEESAITLAEIESKYNEKFATGSINSLVTKGLVETQDTELEYVEVLANDHTRVISGIRKKTIKAWKLTATE